jgi:hypothetical protein
MTTAPTPWCLSYLWNGGFNHGWLWSSWVDNVVIGVVSTVFVTMDEVLQRILEG